MNWLADYILIVRCQIQSNLQQTNSRKKPRCYPFSSCKSYELYYNPWRKKYDVVRCKKVYKQQPFFDRDNRKSRGHIFQSLSFHFFLIQSLWCLRSQNKSFLAASKQAVFFKKTTQLDGCLLLCRKKKKKILQL